MSSVATKAESISVGMGDLKSAEHPERLVAVLGSCIGVALVHPRHNFAVMAHVMLPNAAGRDGPPGKFADTAIPKMVELFEQRGIARHGLIAKIAGGSSMFGNNGPMQIGESNVEAVEKALKKLGVVLRGKDVGGSAGRRVALNCESGELTIARIGSDDLII